MSNDAPHNRKAKILLMDDDEVIRTAVRGLLENLGYKVETCGDGKQAIALYKKALQEESPFDAVVMDLNIPEGMGGTKAMKELLAIDPGVKGIVSSGFPNDSVMSDCREFGFSGVVEKPYKIEELDKILVRVIGEEFS